MFVSRDSDMSDPMDEMKQLLKNRAARVRAAAKKAAKKASKEAPGPELHHSKETLVLEP